jgi:DNA-nicking Smr family endonuclease
MSNDRPRHRRRLSEDEQHLWGNVARSVTPMRRARTAATAEQGDAQPPPRLRHAPPASAAPATPPATPPRLAPIDRRARQKLARGRDPIDARVDLHGMTQAQAHAALARFLRRAQADDAKYVLVVTGKGREPGRGVLRRQVPLWLEQPEFRTLVVGFDTAHIGHGGEGALYVRVRRKR